MKDVDGSSIISEGKHSRRGAGYNSHEVVGLKCLDANFALNFLCFHSSSANYLKFFLDESAEASLGSKIRFWFVILLKR